MSDTVVVLDTGSPPIPVFVSGGADVGPAGPPGPGAAETSRANIAAIAATAGMSRFLAEAGRTGNFVFDSSNLSAKVTADTAQGIYIAPASAPTGASGAWVRKFDGPVNPLWFGIVEGDADGANGVANSAAWVAMWAILKARAKNVFSGQQAVDPILFPHGWFEFDDTIEIDYGATVIEGAGGGFPTNWGTMLSFPASTTGILLQAKNTSGASGAAVATHAGGSGTIIRNVALSGGYASGSPVEAEAHGIQLRGRAAIENVFIQNFQGDGIYSHATAGSGTNEGNTNNSRILGSRIQGCRNGLYLDGADANIWMVDSLDVTANRQWGVWDSSFLGNSYFALHAASNGHVDEVDGVVLPASVVSHGGNRYYAIAGQEAGASTNAPTGTTANNTWWGYIGAGAPDAGRPAWFSGITVRAGGSYYADGSNAASVFLGCYAESGQGKAQIASPSMVLGGFMAGHVVPHVNPVLDTAQGGYWNAKTGFRSTYAGTTSTRYSQLGEASTSGTLLLCNDSVVAPSSHRLKYDGTELILDYANAGANLAFTITGPTTTAAFGTSAAVPHAFLAAKLMIGPGTTNARLINNGTVAPTTGAHAAGEWVLNRSPSAGGPILWICRTAGTPGTWDEIYSGGVTIQSVTSGATVTPTFSNDQVNITAQAAALNLANPTGTARDGHGIVIRIKDNGTARAISYGTQYRAMGIILPTTTVVSKTLYLGMVFNNTDTKWDVVSVAQEA